MRKKVGVILSGCGVYDGAEIAESVITLLTLDRAGVAYECLAPDIDQMHVINHLTGEVEAGETRNVLVEAARIARGKVKNLALANGDDYDALFFPGGFGAAKNLCDFAVKGADCTLHPEVERLAKEVASAGKPIGFICIAPAMIPRIYGPNAKLTIGNDAETGIITKISERHSSAKNASENMPFRRRGNAQPTRLRRSGLAVGSRFPRCIHPRRPHCYTFGSVPGAPNYADRNSLGEVRCFLLHI